MKVLTLSDLPIEGESCITIGGFDGLHVGHQELIRELINCAKFRGQKSVLLTFKIPPQVILRGWKRGLLTPIEEKLEILRNFPLDYVLVLEFNEKLKGMRAEEFVRSIAMRGLNTKTWILGYNHHFGRDREGGAIYLIRNIERWPFYINVIPPILWRGSTITSTRIREECLKGNIKLVNRFLGRPYQLVGKVVHGDRRGHLTGFPTANLQMSPIKLLPKRGVYAAHVEVDGKLYKAVVNIGTRPTFGGKRVIPEIHIIDFDGDLYGKVLKVFLIEYLREEIRFESVDSLKEQIRLDLKRAREVLTNT